MDQQLQHSLLSAFEERRKSPGVALALCFILGIFGAHRFYLRRSGTGTVMLITTIVSYPLMLVLIGFFSLGIIAIWVLVDLFLVVGWAKEFNLKVLNDIKSMY